MAMMKSRDLRGAAAMRGAGAAGAAGVAGVAEIEDQAVGILEREYVMLDAAAQIEHQPRVIRCAPQAQVLHGDGSGGDSGETPERPDHKKNDERDPCLHT